VMNEAGIDLVTFGNHEFDLKPAELQRCIDRSRFEWVNINSRDSISNFSRSFMQWKDSVATPIPYTVVKNFKDEEGNTMSVGFFGVTIRTSAHTHVAYDDIKSSAAMALRELKGRCDVIVAITHLSMKEDKQLASDFPEINLVIGGHEHIYSYNSVGTTPIAKADANARSMYVHKLAFNKDNHKVSITSNLVRIDDRMAGDVATRQVADTWNKRADSLLKAKGFSPCRVVASPGVAWDATDNSIRADTTNLSLLIGKAMMAVVNNNADFALYNSGSLRLDDSLRAPVTEYDIFRLMPYDNLVRVVMLKGNVLLQALQVSDTSRGDGCFLQHDGSISKDKGTGSWLINGKAINPGASYRVATTDYLAEGKQPRMEFLGGAAVPVGSPASAKIVEPDLRKAVMDYMTKMYKPNGGLGKVGVLPCY
jgi:5'-nucleotidase / UDP-sugar diphosphatase